MDQQTWTASAAPPPQAPVKRRLCAAAKLAADPSTLRIRPARALGEPHPGLFYLLVLVFVDPKPQHPQNPFRRRCSAVYIRHRRNTRRPEPQSATLSTRVCYACRARPFALNRDPNRAL